MNKVCMNLTLVALFHVLIRSPLFIALLSKGRRLLKCRASSDNGELDTSCASGMTQLDLVSPNRFAVLEDPEQ